MKSKFIFVLSITMIILFSVMIMPGNSFVQYGTFRALVDLITGANTTIDYALHEIHEGDHFYIEGYTTLGNGDSLMIKLVTPDSVRWAHFTWSVSSSGITTSELYEGATGSMTGGTSMTALNNNRNSLNASAMTLTSGVLDADTLGTLVSNAKWGLNDRFSASGGSVSREDELMLRQNTTYLRRFISGTADNIIQFKASWYEHTSKK